MLLLHRFPVKSVCAVGIKFEKKRKFVKVDASQQHCIADSLAYCHPVGLETCHRDL